MKKRSWLALSSAAFLLAITTACGNGDGSEGTAGQGEQQETSEQGSGNEISGNVAIDGSSTVFPIMEAVSEEYAAAQPSVQAPVGVSGTGGGFEKFIAGETDISNASRPISEEEVAQLEENGIEFTEFEIAYDGLSVIVNKENDFIDHITVDELRKMWLESGNVKTWADVREGWPEEPIKFFSPGTDSGTYDYWNEVILEEQQIRKDTVLSEDDNTLVQGVLGNKNAISYFGYAYYIENKDNLKVVPVTNSAGENIEPSEETIRSGEYEPLSRPMYIYVRNDSLKDKPQVYDYVKFALENAGTLSNEVGYIGLPDEKYEESLTKLDEAAGK